MKTHLAWIRVTASAAIVAGALPAAAQYAPYRPIPQQPAAQPQTPAQAAPTQAPYASPWQAAPQQAAVGPYRGPAVAPYPQTAAVPYRPAAATQQNAPVYPQAAAAYPQTGPQYQTTYPGYPAVARQPNESLPAPRNGEAELAPAPVNGGPMNGAANGHVMPNGQVMPNGHSMPHSDHGYAAGSYYGDTTGCNQNGYTDYGVSSYLDNPCHDSQWFGGVYFLFMERDNASPVKLTVEVDHAVVPDPYYPPGTTTVVSTHQTDHDFREGVEVRFGSTFTISDSYDSCDSGLYGHGGCNSCAPCAPDVYAWEVAWWGIDDDANTYTFVDQVPTRIYGMKNFVGLEYDRDGAGAGYIYRPVNEYYGYALPIPDPGPPPYVDGYLSVLAQRVRTNFKAQNLELNFIRFPVCEVACGGCNTGCDSGCYGDYGYNASGCEPSCAPSAFSAYASCGVRYFRADDDFMYANEFTEWAAGAPDKAGHDGFYDDESSELYYDVQVDNHLVGPQLGWTMNYCVACKWNFFCNSTFGVFNNHINHRQQMWGGGDGVVRFAGDGSTFDVKSEKDDIAFLGEMRIGGSYDLSCHWRAVAAYRAVAMAGIATSTDQIPQDFTNKEYVQIIDSDNSMIVHGVQVGAECRY